LPATPFFAVGAEAAKRLRAAGFLAERVSEGACAPALSRAFGRPQGKAVVVFGAEGGRRDLCDELAKLGMRVEYKGIYRVQVQWPRHGVPAADLVVLPSSTAATLLLDGPPGGSLRGLPMVAIGEKTERAARTLGARDVVRSNQDTRESVVEAVLALCGNDQRTPEGARAAKPSGVAHPSSLNPVTQEASHV
jgi:uroporphyrinogen-III synthase